MPDRRGGLYGGGCEVKKEVYAMALSPFRGFYDMQSEMNRMFDEVFGNLARSGGRRQQQQGVLATQ